MKKFYFALALLFSMGAFLACSDDDNSDPEDDGDKKDEVVYKQVKSIVLKDDLDPENSGTILFVYDENKMLTKADDWDYTRTANAIQRSRPDKEDHGLITKYDLMDFTLKNNRAETVKETTGRGEGQGLETYTYNVKYDADGYLETVTTRFSWEDADRTETFTYTNGSLTKYVRVKGGEGEKETLTLTFTPGTVKNIASVDLFSVLEPFDFECSIEMFLLDIAGKRSEFLPSKVIMLEEWEEYPDEPESEEISIKYTTDAEGYVTGFETSDYPNEKYTINY